LVVVYVISTNARGSTAAAMVAAAAVG